MAASVLPVARSAHAAGLACLPVAEDGSKRPDVAAWIAFKAVRPTADQMRAWDFGHRYGLGMIAGPVSAYTEAWDFDCRDTFNAFVALADETGLGDVVARLRRGYEDATPAGGARLLVRYPAIVTWTDCTLARRPGRAGEPAVKTLIELPTFSIIAPSGGPVHPSGKPYVHVSGDVSTIAAYTVEERTALFDLARSFDQMPRRDAQPRPAAAAPGTRPGDDYNRRMTWSTLLERHGWTPVYDRGDTTYWRRPGKSHGISATTNHAGSDLFYPFTGSTTFDPDTSYSKFGVYAVLDHDGDYAHAAKQLAADGYGEAEPSTAGASRRHGPAAADASLRPVVVCLSDVQPEDISWLWPGRIAGGKVGLLIGDPGLGKSWISLDVAARVSRGGVWPDTNQPPRAPASVLLLSVEDGLADTVRPRLDRLQADVSRVHHLAVLRSGEDERMVQLADVGALTAAIAQVRATLLVIDPISAYLGDTDSHRDAAVRGLLSPLARIAEQTGTAVLGIMHLAKSTQQSAIYRAIGSIAFAAAARTILAVAKDPQSDRRVLASVKSNLGAPPATLSYALTDGRLEWGATPVDDVDINSLLAAPSFDRAEQHEADTWLGEALAQGPVKSKDLERDADASGISRRTLFRAKQRLHIEAEHVGFGRGSAWYWSLPTPQSATPKGATEEMAPFEETPVNTAKPSNSATSDLVATFDDSTRPPAWVLADDGACPPAEAPFADRDSSAPRPGRCAVCDCPLTHPRAGERCRTCRRQRRPSDT